MKRDCNHCHERISCDRESCLLEYDFYIDELTLEIMLDDLEED